MEKRGPGRPRTSAVTPASREITPQQQRAAVAARRAMQQRSMTQAMLAEMAGVSTTAVENFLSCRKSSLVTTMERIAKALDFPLAEGRPGVTYPQLKQATTIEIRGGATHGAWKSMALEDVPRGAATDVIPLDQLERYAPYPRFAVEVEDDSLMGYVPPVPRGYSAVIADLRGADIEIESGRVYLIHRTGPGELIQTAFWRITVYRDRYELVPLWADAAKNAAGKVAMPREEFEHGRAVTVGGILLGSTMRVV